MAKEKESRAIAERVLRDTWDCSVQLGEGNELGGSSRSHVYRCVVEYGPEDAPDTVVVKHTVPVNKERYEPDQPKGAAVRLFNDWAGLKLLTDVCGEKSPAPHLYGGDRDTGLIVMSDFGACTQLDRLLLGDDAEAAEAGLLALAKSLGCMHAMTAGQGDVYRSIRTGLGPIQAAPDVKATQEQFLKKFEEMSRSIGVDLHPDVKTEAALSAPFLTPDGPFAAYIHHDPCPDNCLMVDDALKLLDFEFGAYDNALIDGVYGRIHFPSCWCVNRLPDGMFEKMEDVYRKELMVGCEAARDDAQYQLGVVSTCAMHVVHSWWASILEKDDKWGIATIRQRVLVRFEIMAQTAETFGMLEATGATIGQMLEKLKELWKDDVEEMPLYPAFR